MTWLALFSAAWASPPAQEAVLQGLPQVLLESISEVEHQAAPELGEDLRAPHLLAEVRRGKLVVRDLELEQRTEDWLRIHPDVQADPAQLSQALLARQIAHVLVHELDSGASRSERWRGISDWGSWGPGEQDLLSYANPYALSSPAEDMATAAEHLLTGIDLPGDPSLSGTCRLRTKLRAVSELLALPEPDFSACSSLEGVGLDPAQILGLELLYVLASSADPSSVGGHLMLGVRHREDGRERLDAYTLVAVTDGTPSTSPMYVVRGLSGGFPSIVRREPFAMMVLRYAQEDRGIQRIPLQLSGAQLRAGLERLDEVRVAWSRPYLFLTRNCTQLPKLILEAALGADLGLPDIYGPDSIIGAAQRLGVAELEDELADTPSPVDRAQVAEQLRWEAAGRALQSAPSPELDAALDQVQSRRPEERGQAYLALGAMAGRGVVAEELSLFLLFSESVEQEDGVLNPQSPAVQGLWKGLSLCGVMDPQVQVGAVQARAMVEQGLQPKELPEHTHSSLRRVSVSGGVDAKASPRLEVSTHLYAYGLGEARRYPLADGLDVSVLPLWIALGAPQDSGPVALGVQASLVHYQHIKNDRHVMNPGFVLRGASLLWQSAGPSAIEPIQASLALELLQGRGHQHHLGISLGVAPGWTRLPEQTLQGGLGTPIGVFGRLGSGQAGLTGLQLDATLTPLWAAESVWWSRSALSGQVRIGELRGSDVALSLTIRDQRWGAGLAQSGQEQSLLLGFAVEPY